jgi:predicted DNA-binding transcriptional regulator AlpA
MPTFPSPGLPASGYIRLSEVLRWIPVSRATWYRGIDEGKFPAPVKITERCSAYRVEDIRALIKSFNEAEAQA